METTDPHHSLKLRGAAVPGTLTGASPTGGETTAADSTVGFPPRQKVLQGTHSLLSLSLSQSACWEQKGQHAPAVGRSHDHLWPGSTAIFGDSAFKNCPCPCGPPSEHAFHISPSPAFPVTPHLAIAQGIPPGSGTRSEPSHTGGGPAPASAAPSSASQPGTAPKAAEFDVVILVSIAERRCGDCAGSNSLSQLLPGVHVICSPALPHSQVPR